jgi:hypothetical protein
MQNAVAAAGKRPEQAELLLSKNVRDQLLLSKNVRDRLACSEDDFKIFLAPFLHRDRSAVATTCLSAHWALILMLGSLPVALQHTPWPCY